MTRSLDEARTERGGVCRWCGFVIDFDGSKWVTSISRGARCKPSPSGVHERPRGRVAVLCDSTCDGALCDKPLDHVGVHRSWEGNFSWGTAADLSASLADVLPGEGQS